MIISTEHNFIFLCTPKCASNSIEKVLSPYVDISFLGRPALRHTTALEVKTYILPFLKHKRLDEEIETICLIREPLSWLFSWYRFRSRRQLNGNPNSTYGISFEEFIEEYLSASPKPFADVGTQYGFVSDDQNQICVDRMFRYEELHLFIQYMNTKLQEKLELNHLNASPSNAAARPLEQIFYSLKSKILRLTKTKDERPRQPLISPELLTRLKSKNKDDFELYGSI